MFYRRIISRRNWGAKRRYRPTRKSLLLTLLLLLFSILPFQAPVEIKTVLANNGPYSPSPVIQDISFDRSSHIRLAQGSDNWSITWADNDHQYTTWGDGGGIGGSNTDGRVSLGVARIEGTWDNYRGSNVWGGQSPENQATFSGKSYGIISIDGVLYIWVSPGSMTNSYAKARLFHSTDYGATWTPADWAFVKADGLIMPTILNFGKNYAGARDNFVYHYFIELQGNPTKLDVHIPGKVHLLRVDKNEMLTSKSSYEYFNGLDGNGDPIWSKDINVKQPVFQDPNGVGWTLAVSYNAGLERYILTTEHTESNQGNLGIFDAPEPWGPWTTVAYLNRSDGTRFAHDFPAIPETTFFWNFANKWLSEDGEEFTLVFTGTGKNDSWNTIRGTFTLANQPPAAPSKVVSNLSVASGKPYQVVDDGLVSGAPFFIDRDFTFKSIPATVQGAAYIKTANDDKGRKDAAFLSFQVGQDTTVYVAYDHRASSLPDWLKSWNGTGESITTTDVSFKLFARDFAASSTVTLGGNLATGAVGAGSNYFVVFNAATSVNNAPDVSIVSPQERASFLSTDTINFSGTATDLENGDLPQGALVWTSDLDGQIGTGGTATASLSVGVHIITLTGTDSRGASGSDAVTLTVVNLIYGDADEDGQFTPQDVHLVVDWVLGYQPMPQTGTPDFAAADVNGDGEISIDDVKLMIDRMSGKFTQFPVEA
jgi:hypothetical protein